MFQQFCTVSNRRKKRRWRCSIRLLLHIKNKERTVILLSQKNCSEWRISHSVSEFVKQMTSFCKVLCFFNFKPTNQLFKTLIQSFHRALSHKTICTHYFEPQASYLTRVIKIFIKVVSQCQKWVVKPNFISFHMAPDLSTLNRFASKVYITLVQ